MSSGLKRAGIVLLAAPILFVFFLIPSPARAADNIDAVLAQVLTSHQVDYNDEDGYGNYSSSIKRKIRKLDDEPVEEIPVPVLFVSYAAITSDFGDPRGGGTRTHEGQDIVAPRGSFIVSPTDAVVTGTGKGSSAGVYVYTAGPGGETFRYMHLDAIAPGIKSGTVLKPGDLIGFVGDTGNAKGAGTHLHFEIRSEGSATDPYPRMTEEFSKEELLSSLLTIVDALRKLADD